jgi:hypothetical protein
MAVRQQLRQSNNKASSSRSSKEKNTVNEEVNKLRSGDLTSVSIDQFLNCLTIQSQLKQEELLGKLNGKELATILKSVGKPSFLGKKKSQQITTLLEVLKAGNITVKDIDTT